MIINFFIKNNIRIMQSINMNIKYEDSCYNTEGDIIWMLIFRKIRTNQVNQKIYFLLILL